MNKYVRFFESYQKIDKYNDGSFFTILDNKAKVGDILPLYSYKNKKEILCRVIEIQETDTDDSWKWSFITRSHIDYAIYVTPIRRSKNIYKKYVTKSGEVDWEWRQINVSDSYYSKSDKEFSKMFFGEGSPLTNAKSQDDINNDFKAKLTKYAPEFQHISYSDLISKYRDIASLINMYYDKTYDDRKTKILDYWGTLIEGVNPKYPHLKIKSIVNIGNKKYALLTDNKTKVHVNPKEILDYIMFRLKTK